MIKNKSKDTLREKVIEVLIPGACWSDEERADEILSLVSRELLRRLPKKDENPLKSEYVMGWNQALSEVKTIIKDMNRGKG